MRILILGGTSFIGPWVVRSLVDAGHTVTVFHRGSTTATLPDGVRHILGNRAGLPEFRSQFLDVMPDAVIDMLAMTEKSARMVVQTLGSIAARLIVVSSCDVYRAMGRLLETEPGDIIATPLTEDAPLREKLYPYREMLPKAGDYDKIPVERVFMNESAVPGTVLRLPFVYGPGDYQHRLRNYVRRMDDARPYIPLDENEANWRTTRGYVENVAHAIALAATDERAAGRIYNVGAERAFSEREWVETIGAIHGWRGSVAAISKGQLPGHDSHTQDLTVATDRIRTELGFSEPVALDEGIRRTIAWERERMPPLTEGEYEAEDAALQVGGYLY